METENKYKYSKAYFKLLDLITNNPKETVFVIRGGQGASKTISILELLIQSLVSNTKEVSVISSELSKMKRTVIRDYKKIAKDWGVLEDGYFNKSENKHEYNNESYIDFLGADVNDVGKGFRRDIIYINEADKMDIDTAVQFISRAGLTIIDYNPDSLFWGDDYINENNFITLTFEDNEYLPQSEVDSILDYKKKGFHNSDLPFELLFKEDNIKSNYWSNKWKVYGLGMVGNLDGVVFDNWQQIDSIPKEARLLGIGMDFGYSNDPTAIVEVWKWNDKRILNEICYRKGLVNSDIAEYLPKNIMVYADCAEPKSIEEIKRLGVSMIQGVSKGADSINFGIQLMQEQNYLVTKKSVNVIEELQKYTWKKDKKTNDKLNKPIDKYNHCFVYETLITTNKGLKQIGLIKVGDVVLTSNGYKRVLKKFDNGIKKTNEYLMQFDTFSLSLRCTDNHKIKTTNGWRKIKNLTANDILYIKESDIFQEEQKDCIELYGSSTMGKYQKDFTYTTSTMIRRTMQLKTCKLLKRMNIYRHTQRYFTQTTQISQLTTLKKIKTNVKNGIRQKRELNGISNTGRHLGIIEPFTKQRNVRNAAINIKQGIKEYQDFAIITVKLNRIEEIEPQENNVYDFMVEDTHEYFANGVLVHNCIDAIRYHEMETLATKQPFFIL